MLQCERRTTYVDDPAAATVPKGGFVNVEDIARSFDTKYSGAHFRGCIPTLGKAIRFIQADLYRYEGALTLKAFVKSYLFKPGFTYTTWMRLCSWARGNRLARFTIYPFMKWRLLQLRYKFGIAIPEQALIGPGFFINRFGGVYIVGDAIIGTNVNLTHGSMIGLLNRGKNAGSPIIGDKVFFGSGAKAIGGITIGDECSIGVNSVVTKSLDPRSVAVGMPAKVISDNGSEGYINRAASEAMIAATGWHEMLAGRAKPVSA